jgi:hypothetical protein
LITAAVWDAKTPRNAHEFDAQTKLVCNHLRDHLYTSPSTVIAMVQQLNQGATKFAHAAVLNQRRTAALEAAVEEATKRKRRIRKRIQEGGALTVEQGLAGKSDRRSNTATLAGCRGTCTIYLVHNQTPMKTELQGGLLPSTCSNDIFVQYMYAELATLRMRAEVASESRLYWRFELKSDCSRSLPILHLQLWHRTLAGLDSGWQRSRVITFGYGWRVGNVLAEQWRD